MSLIKTSVVASALTFTALLSPAFADEPLAPAFTTLDRQSSQTSAGIDMQVTSIDDIDTEFVRMDLHGQWVAPQGYGAYLNLPLSEALVEQGDNVSALGNVELGGMVNLRLRPDLQLNLHGGMLLPTAEDDFDGVVTNLFSSFGRITDLAASAPDSTWLRVGASPTYRSGQLFARADIGFDVAVDAPKDSDLTKLFRANVGAGIDLGTVALMGEVTTLALLDDQDGAEDDDDERFVHTGAVTARFNAGNGISPSVSFTMPLDDSGRGDIWTVGAGVNARF